MLHATAGQLLINDALPADMRDHSRVLDKKGVAALFDALARQHPADYRDVAKRLADVGRDAAYATGGFSFGLGHMRPTVAGERIKGEARAEIMAINARRDLAPADKDQAVIAALQRRQKPLEDAVFAESLAEGNPLARQVMNVGRGNKTSLKSLRAGDLLYEDHHGRPIPVPIFSPYSKGLTPVEYWAAGFGARKGVWDTKNATQRAGFLSKQLNQVTHRLVVTAHDADDHDPGARRGLPVDADDPDNAGALLAHPAGTYPRDTVLTPAILADLAAQGHPRILVRSPTVGGPPEGGVYAKDAGVRERGGLPPRGDFIGMAAAQALSEKLTQGQLCLAAGTLVRMADGSTKAIEDIVPGDVVIAVDRYGQPRASAVAAVHANGVRECQLYVFEWHNRRDKRWETVGLLWATPDHKVLRDCNDRPEWASDGSAFGLVPLGDWPAGSSAIWIDPNEDGCTGRPFLERAYWQCNDVVRLADNPRVPRPLDTFDLTIDHPDHRFLLASGLVVSNSSKHAGGVAGANAAVSGFGYINQLIQTPRTFPGGAAHAQADGRVTGIEAAPQGGTYITVAGARHHAAAGQAPRVKVGDDVEAGDVLSDGIPNPAEIVAHKGVGAGRRHFVAAFMDAYRNSGMAAHRRNVELLARGLIDHVRLTDEVGDHSPDDVIPYQALEHSWEPRDGARRVAPAAAVGKYLEGPALHHTIGTKVRPSMLADFRDFGVKDLLVHDDPPPFEPVMIRGMANLQFDPDWMTRHLGSNLQKGTLDAVHRGLSSDTAGTSFVPAIASNRLNFGREGLTRGWQARDGDGDGKVGDGTPGERPVRSIMGDDR